MHLDLISGNRLFVACSRFARCVCLLFTCLVSEFAWSEERPLDGSRFSSLCDVERRMALNQALVARLEACSNAKAVSSTHIYNAICRQGEIAEALPGKDWAHWDCELRRIGQDYWFEEKWIPTHAPDQAMVHAFSQFIAADGIVKGLAKHRSDQIWYGAIGKQHDPMLRCAKFNYWFDLPFDVDAEFPIVYLLKNIDGITFGRIDLDLNEVEIELKTTHALVDSREITLSIEKGFLPVRMQRILRFVDEPANEDLPGIQLWKADELKRVDDVWFPWSSTTVIVTDSQDLPEHEVTVYKTTVESLELGTVKPQDLQLGFQAGLRVADRIQGRWITIDE